MFYDISRYYGSMKEFLNVNLKFVLFYFTRQLKKYLKLKN